MECCEAIYRLADTGRRDEVDGVAQKAVAFISNYGEGQALWEAFDETQCREAQVHALEKVASADADSKRLCDAERANVLDLYLDRRDEAVDLAAPVAEGEDRAAYKARAVLAGDDKAKLEALASTLGDVVKKVRRTPEEPLYMQDLADLYAERLHSLKDAEEYYKRIKLADPKSVRMLRFYCKYYEQASDWQRMLSSLQTLKNAVSGSYRELNVSREIARISEDKLNNPGKAVNVWNQLLKDNLFTDVAREELIGLYIRTQKWQALLEIYKNDMEALGEDKVGERIAILRKCIDIYDNQLHLDAMVIKMYHQILAIDPNNDEAVNALIERYEASKRWNDLLKILTQKAESTTDKATSVELYYRIANLWSNSLGNVAKSVDPLLKVVELDPGQKNALRQLHEFYEQRNNWANLYDIIEKESAIAEGAEKIALLKRQAEIGETNLHSTEKAVSSWEAMTLVLSDPSEALEELARLYRKEEKYEALLGVYKRELEFAHSTTERIDDLNAIAQIYMTKLHARDKAIETWTEIIDIPEGREDALSQLTQIRVEAQEWEELVKLYVSLDRAEQVYDLLDLTAGNVDDEETQIELYNIMADVAQNELHDDERAVSAYEKILDVDATHEATAKRLLQFYRVQGKHAKAIEAIQIIIAWTSDLEEKIRMHVEIADLYEKELCDIDHAANWYAKAVSLAPNRSEMREHFEELVNRNESPALLYEVYNALTKGDLLDENSRLSVHRALARVCEKTLDKPVEAIASWEVCLAADAQDGEALDALCRLYEENCDWEKLLGIVDRKIALEKSDEEICRLSFKRAELLVGQLNRLDEAEQSYRRILSIDETNLRALDGLKGIYDVTENWQKLADVLRVQLDLVTDGRLDIMYERAEIERIHLHQIDEAIGLYAAILDEDPGHERTVATLEALVREGVEQAKIARILEPVYERAGATEKQCQALEIVLKTLEKDEKVPVLWQIYELRNQELHDDVAAFDVAVRLFMATPDDERVWDNLAELAGEDESRWKQISALYADIPADEDHTENWRYEILRRRALIVEEKLHDEAESIELWEELHVYEPEEIECIRHLEKLYKDSSSFEKLVKLLEFETELAHFSDEERVKIHLEAAQIYEDILEKPQEAIRIYRLILDVDNGCEEALLALERLYSSCEQWRDLASLYEDELTIYTDSVRLNDIQCKLASVCETHLSDYARAVECYQNVLGADRHHDALDSAYKLLQKLASMDDEHVVEYRASLCELLEPIYIDAKNLTGLIDVLRIRLADASDNYDRIELNRRIAGILRDELQDNQGAFEAVKSALRIDLSDEALRHDFETLAISLGNPQAIIELYETGIADVDDDVLKHEIYRRMASVYEEELHDTDKAIQAYRAMIELDDMDKSSLNALEVLYTNTQNWEELLDILKRKADIGTGDEKVDILRKMATINCDCLNHPKAAIDNYCEILDNLPDDTDALDALESLYVQIEDWKSLCENYGIKLQLATDDENRRVILKKMADIQENKLHSVDDSIDIYVQVLDIFPEDVETLDALDRLYLERESYDELSDILQRKLALHSDDEQTDELEFRLGQLAHHKLDSVEQAIEYYRTILERHPDHQQAHEALRELLQNEEYHLEASRVLEGVYERTDQFAQLIEVLEIQLADEADPYSQGEFLKRIASIHQDKLSDFQAAFHDYARILKINQEPQFIDQIENLSEVLNNKSELAQVFVDVVANVYEPELQVTFHNKIGDLYLNSLNDEEKAKENFKATLEIQPDDRHALETLDAIYTERQNWTELLDILDAKLQATSEASIQTDLLYRIADIQETRCEAHDEAIATYQRILENDSSAARAKDELSAIYTRQEMWTDLADLIRNDISAATDPALIAELKFKLAVIQNEKLLDEFEAIQTLQEILAVYPEDVQAREYLENLFDDGKSILTIAEILEPIYKSQNNWDKLIHSLEVRAAQEEDEFSKLQILEEIATTWLNNLNNAPKALETYGRMFEIQPSDRHVQEQVEKLASQTLNLEAWAGLYRKALKENRIDDDIERGRVTLSLARLLTERMNNEEESCALCSALIEENPEEMEAYEILEWTFAHKRDYPALLKLWIKKAEIVQDDTQKQDLLVKIATIQEEILHNEEDACETYRQLLDIDASNSHAALALERLLRKLGQFKELAIFYRQQVDYAPDDSIRVEYLHKLGLLLARDLHEIEEAVDVFGNALSIDANSVACKRAVESMLDDLPATDENAQVRNTMATMLEPLYTESDWSKLARVLSVLIDTCDDPLGRVSLLMRLAALYEAHDSHLKRAFDTYAKAFVASPGTSEARDKIENIAMSLENYAQLAEVYSQAVENCDDDVDKVGFYERLADIWMTKLDNDENASQCYEAILKIDEFHMKSIVALESLYAKAHANEKNVEILKRHVDVVTDLIDRKDLLYRIAELQENALHQPQEAIKTYLEVLDLDAEDALALDALEKLYLQSENWTELVDIYKRKIDVTSETASRIELEIKVAQTSSEKLNDSDTAIEYYSHALDDDRNNIQVLNALEQLYCDTKRYADVIDIIQMQVDYAQANDLFAMKVENEIKLARILIDHLEEKNRAIEVLKEVLDNDGQNQSAIEMLNALLKEPEYVSDIAAILKPIYKQNHNDEAYLELCRLCIENSSDEFERRAIYLDAASVADESLNDPERAFEFIKEAILINPTDDEVLERAQSVAQRHQCYALLTSVCEKVIAQINDPDALVSLSFLAAKYYEEQLANGNKAIEQYERVLESDSLNEVALVNLHRLYKQIEDIQKLADVLGKLIDAGIQPINDFRLELVQLKIESDPVSALELLKQIVWEEPTNESAIAALETLLGHKELVLDIVDILEPKYQEAKEFQKYTRLLQAKFEATQDPVDAMGIIKQLAMLQLNELNDQKAAFEAYLKALSLDPSDVDVLRYVDELGQKLMLWNELVSAYSKAIEASTDDEQKVALMLKMAQIQNDKLQNVEDAKATLVGILKIDSENIEAARKLADIYTAMGDNSALLDVLARIAELTYEVAAQKDLLFRCADIALNTLNLVQRGTAFLEKIVELDDSDMNAIEPLLVLYQEAESFEKYADMLNRKLLNVQDEQTRFDVYVQIAKTYEDKLDDPASAIEAYQSAMEIHRSPLVFQALENLYRKHDQFQELDDLFLTQLDEVQEPVQKAAIRVKRAEIAENAFKDDLAAIDLLKDALHDDPRNVDAFNGLDRIYSKNEDYQELFELLKEQKEKADSSELELMFNIRLAKLAATHLGDTDTAIASLTEVFKTQPNNLEAIDSLIEIYEQQKSYDLALNILRRKLECMTTNAQKACVYCHVARIISKGKWDVEQIACSYQAALTLDPKNTEALDALMDIAQKKGDIKSILDLLNVQAENEEDSEKKIQILLKIAETASENADFAETEAKALATVFASHQEDVDLAEKLVNSYIKANDFAAAQPVLDKIIEQLAENKQNKRLPTFYTLKGRILKLQGNREAARTAFEAANAIDKNNIANNLELGILLYEAGDYEAALKIMQTLLLHQMNIKDIDVKTNIFYYLGMLRLKTNDAKRAKDMFNRALGVNPNHEPTKQAMAQLS